MAEGNSYNSKTRIKNNSKLVSSHYVLGWAKGNRLRDPCAPRWREYGRSAGSWTEQKEKLPRDSGVNKQVRQSQGLLRGWDGPLDNSRIEARSQLFIHLNPILPPVLLISYWIQVALQRGLYNSQGSAEKATLNAESGR